MQNTATAALHPSFWKAAYTEHSSAVLAFLTSRVGRRDVAEDLLQETFVRAMRAEALRDPARVRSYLMSTAYRLVIDRVRKKRPVLFTEMADEQLAVDFSDSDAPLPDEHAEARLVRQRLDLALQTLSAPLRTAFEAAVIEQRPYAEIAVEHQWTEGQVRVNVHRARKKVIVEMRAMLQLDPGDEP